LYQNILIYTINCSFHKSNPRTDLTIIPIINEIRLFPYKKILNYMFEIIYEYLFSNPQCGQYFAFKDIVFPQLEHMRFVVFCFPENGLDCG